MLIHEARAIADDVMVRLAPHCHRIQIAGSIRRLKPIVKDIEIVAISIFGGDGTINLANIILFVGLVLFVVSFMIRRR